MNWKGDGDEAYWMGDVVLHYVAGLGMYYARNGEIGR